MPRVFHVDLTKQFDCNILADSEDELLSALQEEEPDIDRQWDPPDWTFSAQDPLKLIKRSDKMPDQLPTFNMAVVNGEIYCARGEGSSIQSQIDAMREKAESELNEMRLKLGVSETNTTLPFIPSEPGREALRTMQDEQRPWVKHNFGDRPHWMPLMGIFEELGEYEFAIDTAFAPEVKHEKIVDALCDTMIFAMDFCSAMGWEMIDMWDAAAPFSKMPVGVHRAAGMMAHAFLKTAQGIRVNEDHGAEGRQGMVYLVGHLRLMAMQAGVKLIPETYRVWQKVRQRDWKKDPASAGA